MVNYKVLHVPQVAKRVAAQARECEARNLAGDREEAGASLEAQGDLYVHDNAKYSGN